MKTRRKSKATAQADHDGSQADENMNTIEIPDDIDLESLQNILPDTSLTAPSPDSIVSLYRLLLAQVEEADATQRELEDARAEAEKKDVELDQALQDRESQTKDLETSLNIVQNELKEVKQERDQLGVFYFHLFRCVPFMPYSLFTSRITGSNQHAIEFSVIFFDGSRYAKASCRRH